MHLSVHLSVHSTGPTHSVMNVHVYYVHLSIITVDCNGRIPTSIINHEMYVQCVPCTVLLNGKRKTSLLYKHAHRSIHFNLRRRTPADVNTITRCIVGAHV